MAFRADATQTGGRIPSFNLRAQYPGERHAVVKLPNGDYTRARYLGPGTAVETRLLKHDKPLTASDAAAERHDLDYAFAATTKQVREADEHFLSTIARIEKTGADSRINTTQAKLLRLKTIGEDLGVINPTSITSYGDLIQGTPRVKNLARAELARLKKAGY